MVNQQNRSRELELHCQNCNSIYLTFVAELSDTVIYRCTSCRRRNSWNKTYIANLRRQKTLEEKVNKTKVLTIEEAMKQAAKTLPDAADLYANAKRLSPKLEDVGKPNGVYQYQKEDIEYFLDLLAQGSRVLLNFNKMGLGKTPEGIITVDAAGSLRTLVLCSKNTMPNWKKEIYMWTGEDSAMTLPDTYNKFEDWRGKMLNRWFITNVETLRRQEWADFILKWGFDFIIYDEAHSMRNVEDAAKARQAFFFLQQWLKESEKYTPQGRLLIMSGSPIVNNAADLYPHLALAYPGRYYGRTDFINRECYASVGYKGGVKVEGFINPKGINELILRKGVQHTKEEKLPGLPEKTYNVIALEMEEKQRQVYDDLIENIGIMLDDGKELYAPEILEMFIRMRQICVDPELIGVSGVPSIKLDYLRESFLEEINGEPFVIFSTFETILSDKLTTMFRERGLRVGHITGKVSGDERFRNIEKFQRGDLDVIFATIQAGSEGVTLTRANQIVMLDRWWTPASNEQAVDRLHRISQINAVTVHWLQIQNAFDVYLDTVLEQKRAVAESARTGEVITTAQDVQKEVAKMMFGKRARNL